MASTGLIDSGGTGSDPWAEETSDSGGDSTATGGEGVIQYSSDDPLQPEADAVGVDRDGEDGTDTIVSQDDTTENQFSEVVKATNTASESGTELPSIVNAEDVVGGTQQSSDTPDNTPAEPEDPDNVDSGVGGLAVLGAVALAVLARRGN